MISELLINQQGIRKNGEHYFAFQPGSVRSKFKEAYKFLGIDYPKFYKMDNLCQSGFLAAEILLADAKKDGDFLNAEVGMIMANSVSSIESDQEFLLGKPASPALFVYTLPNIVLGEIAIRNKFYGESIFYIFDHFEPRRMFDDVVYQLQNGHTHCILAWLEVFGESIDVRMYLISDDKKDKEALLQELILFFK